MRKCLRLKASTLAFTFSNPLTPELEKFGNLGGFDPPPLPLTQHWGANTSLYHGFYNIQKSCDLYEVILCPQLFTVVSENLMNHMSIHGR